MKLGFMNLQNKQFENSWKSMTIFRSSCSACAIFAMVSCNSPNPDVCASISNFDVLKANDRSHGGKHPDPPDQCVHRWAYRLAPASGTNTEIARAVVAACNEPIEHAALPADKSTTLDPVAYQQAVKELKEENLEQALFRVVQARAGRCKVK